MFKNTFWFNSKKIIHLIIMILIITAVVFSIGIIVLKYNVEGETNMPFELTKISIISTSEGIDKEIKGYRWGFDVYQSNDIYLYINKNKEYKDVELINKITINNFKVNGSNTKNVKYYRPSEEKGSNLFENIQEYSINNLEYIGDTESNLKELKISNQGGLIVFRCSNNNLSEYKSNEEEISHLDLLRKSGVKEDDINIEISFDLSILLENGREYKTTINLNLPVGDVINKGTTSEEIEDLDQFVFKRVKN